MLGFKNHSMKAQPYYERHKIKQKVIRKKKKQRWKYKELQWAMKKTNGRRKNPHTALIRNKGNRKKQASWINLSSCSFFPNVSSWIHLSRDNLCNSLKFIFLGEGAHILYFNTIPPKHGSEVLEKRVTPGLGGSEYAGVAQSKEMLRNNGVISKEHNQCYEYPSVQFHRILSFKKNDYGNELNNILY